MLRCWAVHHMLALFGNYSRVIGGRHPQAGYTVERLTRGVCCFLCLSEATLLGLNVCSKQMSLLGRATACKGCLRTTQEQWIRIGLQIRIQPQQGPVKVLLKGLAGQIAT